MSPQAQMNSLIPEEIQHVTRVAFLIGNLYLRMRDELGKIYFDETLRNSFLGEGNRQYL